MFKAIQELFSLLTPAQRKRFYSLQVLVVLMAFMELIGIASIGPFMALVADINLLETNAIYKKLYAVSGLASQTDFLFVMGIVVLSMLAIASIISILTTWRMSMFSQRIGTQLADRLYQHYLQQNWLFHAGGSSAQLTKQVATETIRTTNYVINPLMQMNARIVLALFISTAIFVYNPLVALAGIVLFASGYAIIYWIIRRRLVRYGKVISNTNTERFRLMNEGFGGIKDILLLNRQKSFIEQFNLTGETLANAQGKNQAFGQTPRYFMELLAFGAMISLVLALLKMHNGVLSKVLPVLAVYALAGFKLLPALQQIYTSVTQIKGNLASFEAIRSDLINSQKTYSNKNHQIEKQTKRITGNIVLHEIGFTYPGKQVSALSSINLTIQANTTVGLVGESGSGKSTVVDIILGLIKSQSGTLQVGETIIDETNKHLWQQQIGFVAQSIFLSEGTIAENIAFGLRPTEIDISKVQSAAALAHLDELIASLPDGLNTKVGERGVQLSGGQRQRIGIARALYNNASVLVFDEATSALDGITENIIMTAIHELSGKKTIILIAHRLKTVQKCDQIYMLEKGQVIGQGSYKELIENNQVFNEMAQHA